MLFLMNDAVLDVDLKALTPPHAGPALTLPAVLKLGAELFAQAPLLQRTQPERAARLAALIVAKSTQVNAACFEVPQLGCRPDQVVPRLAEVSVNVMAELWAEQQNDALTPVLADRRVWRRMAA